MALLKRINQFNEGIPEWLHELKWQAMQESSFRFYRGTCHLFAEDFVKLYKFKPKVKTWICGDLHFENFGSYKGDNRQVYFDLNDFDEAILAGPEPEVARFITSIIIAAGQMNVPHIKLHKAIHDILDCYTSTIIKRKASMLEAAVAHGEFSRFFSQMSTLNRDEFINHRTVTQKGARALKIDNIHFRPLEEENKVALFETLAPLLATHSRFCHMVFEDAAYRIAGTGSLGLDRYCVLFYSKKKGKRYMVDIKESRESCFTGLIDVKQPRFKNEAERIITAGYLMEFAPPAFLAPLKIDDKWYVVKEMQALSDKMSLDQFGNDFNKLTEVAKEMAVLMAYAHLRSSGNYGSSPIDDLVEFAEKQQWQKDIIDVCGKLAEKNEKYYKVFKKA